VIILHICIPVLSNFSDGENFETALFFSSSVRFCVPIFVMITGVLLLQKPEELSIFLRKRFTRLLFPFIFWSFIYISLKTNIDWSWNEIAVFAGKQLKSGAEFHLWYVYMLIGVYLFIPVLSKWTVSA